MKKENKLFDLNALKINPDLLQDISYLKENLVFLNKNGMRFNDFPNNIQKNPFFILEYFSKIEVNKKEYIHIPKDLLKEQFFVNACLEENPDIYLLSDPECHTEYAFKIIADSHPTKFLKYAKDSDLNNIDYCKKALTISVSNFRYMPEKIRSIHEIILETLKENYRDSYIKASEVVKYIPSEVLDNNAFLNRMLNVNKYVFEFLPTKYKKDELFVKTMICKDTSLFAAIDDSLKRNKEFVEGIFEYKEKIGQTSNLLENFSDGKILKELDESFFTREFCEKHSKELRIIYPEMNKKIRSNLEIIRSIYNHKPGKHKNGHLYNGHLYDSGFLNKIPNQELLLNIKSIVRGSYDSNFYIVVQAKVFKLIDSYILQKELKNTLVENETKKKILKI